MRREECTVCLNDAIKQVNLALADGKKLTDIVAKWPTLSYHALKRHRRNRHHIEAMERLLAGELGAREQVAEQEANGTPVDMLALVVGKRRRLEQLGLRINDTQLQVRLSTEIRAWLEMEIDLRKQQAEAAEGRRGKGDGSIEIRYVDDWKSEDDTNATVMDVLRRLADSQKNPYPARSRQADEEPSPPDPLGMLPSESYQQTCARLVAEKEARVITSEEPQEPHQNGVQQGGFK